MALQALQYARKRNRLAFKNYAAQLKKLATMVVGSEEYNIHLELVKELDAHCSKCQLELMEATRAYGQHVDGDINKRLSKV